MNKRLFTLMLVVLIFISALTVYLWRPEKPTKIALIPLDSRPCNTQYPELLGKMGNLIVDIPDSQLDNYLEKANKEELWQWLTYKATEMDNIIINTTELFNGSLIESRDTASYSMLSADLKRLEEFCRDNPDHEITVITILPRLLPSQFTDLWDYKNELSEYGGALDQALLEDTQLPSANHIPENILNTYLSIYDNAHILTSSLIELAKQGLIDNYIIGQDDAAEYGVSNALIRDLQENYEEEFKENVYFVYGADELTMLAMAKFYLDEFYLDDGEGSKNLGLLGKLKQMSEIINLNDLKYLVNSGGENRTAKFQLTYANEGLKKEYLPFEAITTEEIIQNKLSFLGSDISPGTRNTEFIYNDVGERDFVLKTIKEATNTNNTKQTQTSNQQLTKNTTDNINRGAGDAKAKNSPDYLGIMDVSFTNRGDVGLYTDLKDNKLLKRIDGYAGWNTASNTIGTELAHFYFYHYLKDNYASFTKEAQIEALESYLAFKYVRYAEDFIYQGILQAELEDILKSKGIDSTELEGKKEVAEQILQELFQPYQKELTQQLEGEYKIGDISFTAEDIKAEISLPWERIFEAKVEVKAKVTL